MLGSESSQLLHSRRGSTWRRAQYDEVKNMKNKLSLQGVRVAHAIPRKSKRKQMRENKPQEDQLKEAIHCLPVEV